MPARFGQFAPRAVLALDHHVANWFHQRLTPAFVRVLLDLSEPGSGLWIGVALAVAVLFLLHRRRWRGLILTLLAIPGGMLLGEAVKLLVHRHRPFVAGPFVDWSGYSFPSGHTIGATLLYGSLLLAVTPMLDRVRWRLLAGAAAAAVVASVAFSRVALGAHYLSDVLAAMLLGVLWLGICSVAVGVARPWGPRARTRSEGAPRGPAAFPSAAGDSVVADAEFVPVG